MLRSDQTFSWTDNHQKIVTDLIETLQSPPVLANFTNGLQTLAYVHASQSGLEAILKQKHETTERVIEYASKSLNAHYFMLHSNMLECMAMDWAITEKFSIYLKGGPRYTVVTDNAALTYLTKHGLTNRRFTRWTPDLLEYEFDIIHCSGKLNGAADVLSRLHGHINVQERIKSVAAGRLPLVCSAVVLSSDSRLRTAQDSHEMCLKFLHLANEDNSPYNVQDGVLVRLIDVNERKSLRVVVPKVLQETVMVMCHDRTGHMDADKTCEHVRRRYWWPCMSKDIRDFVRSCHTCQKVNRPTTLRQGLLLPLRVPEMPNSVISADHFGPLSEQNGNAHVLLCVDHATRYLDSVAVPSTSAVHYINFLQH